MIASRAFVCLVRLGALLGLLGCGNAEAPGATDEVPGGAVGLAESALATNVLAQINGEGATVVKLANPSSNSAVHGSITEAGKVYDVVEQVNSSACPTQNTRHRDITKIKYPYKCNHGDRCWLIEGYAESAPPDCNSDRLEMRVGSPSTAPAMVLDQTRFFRFAIRVWGETVAPVNDATIISQVWQVGSVANAQRNYTVGPAFAVVMNACDLDEVDPCSSPTDEIDLRFHTGHVTMEDGQRVDNDTVFLVDRIRRNVWYTYYLQMKARPVETSGPRGAILVWRDDDSFDGTRALNYDPGTDFTCNNPRPWLANHDACYHFYWGYPATATSGFSNVFDVRVGLYRPSAATYVAYQFDDLKVTSSPEAMWGP